MTSPEEKEILQAAITEYGIGPQLDMIVEECAELIQAINKLKRVEFLCGYAEKDFPVPTNRSGKQYCEKYLQLCSEIADVKIMLAQAELILSKEAIDISYERKLNRLKERLKK